MATVKVHPNEIRVNFLGYPSLHWSMCTSNSQHPEHSNELATGTVRK